MSRRGYIVAHNGAPIFGGGEKWTVLLLAALQARGHRVLLLCRGEPVATRAAELEVPDRIARLSGDAMLPDAWRFARLLRREAPDALLLSTFKKIWLGGMAGRWAAVPRVVARVGLSTDLPPRWKYRVALRRWIDVTAVNADEIRRQFVPRCPGLDPRRVVTIYDGVRPPASTGQPGEIRSALSLPPDAFVVGAVARLAAQKRFDRLFHALVELPEQTHCVLAGEGECREKLEALTAHLGIRRRVHFLGYRPDVGTVLEALDVFVVSSDREGMSNAMLEAMAAGVPIVSTAVSGAAEALEPERDGDAPGAIIGFSPRELAAALRRLQFDGALRRRIGEVGRRRARQRFDFERMVDQWETLLLGDRESARPATRARKSRR